MKLDLETDPNVHVIDIDVDVARALEVGADGYDATAEAIEETIDEAQGAVFGNSPTAEVSFVVLRISRAAAS